MPRDPNNKPTPGGDDVMSPTLRPPQTGVAAQQENRSRTLTPEPSIPRVFPGDSPPPARQDSVPVGDWDEFYTDDTIVLYLPAFKQIIFLKDATGDAAQKFWLFDIPTRSWVQGDGQFADSTLYTNADIDSNGNTVLLEGAGSMKKWSDAQANNPTDTEIQFRDEDFGEIGVKKKVYSVAITYKASTNFTTPLEYAADGSASFANFGTASLATATSWETEVFEPTSPVTCESIQFRLNDLSGGTLEIDNLSIEYRILPFARVS